MTFVLKMLSFVLSIYFDGLSGYTLRINYRDISSPDLSSDSIA